VTTFTIIADCLGGTFVSQHEASDQNAALKEWAGNPPRELLSFIESKSETASQVLPESVPLTGMLDLDALDTLQAVWGGYVELLGKGVFLNVVRTQTKA
jgi:hypothetical protein